MDDQEYASHLRDAAGRWRAFPLDVFSDDGLGPELGATRGHELAAAQLTAGAIMAATETLLDQLFDDQAELISTGADTVADYGGDSMLLALDQLPPRYGHRYDQLFVRKFIVATVAVTTRLTAQEWTPAVTVAEELALYLVGEQAEVLLEIADDEGAYPGWRGTYNDLVLEDPDYEVLFEPSLDGIEDDEAGRALGMAPMSFDAWFRPFNDQRRTHPYATDA